jgi:hypothetical protein
MPDGNSGIFCRALLLGEKARLETGGTDVVTNNFAGVDPDISTRGTVGT